MIEWNTIKYIDCLDPKEGLPSLLDKSFDLCITDPPWNYNFAKRRKKDRVLTHTKTNRKLKTNENLLFYNDNYSDEWNLKWFNEVKRICNGIIIIMGTSKLIWWIKNTNPRGIMILYFKNGTSQSKISKFNCYSPYLFYGDYFRKRKIFHNVIEYTIPWGFLSDKRNYIHPSPKGSDIPVKLFKDLKPRSVLDPFMGSGSVAEACKALGIPYFGYEIESAYKKDYELRMKNVKIIPKLKQKVLNVI